MDLSKSKKKRNSNNSKAIKNLYGKRKASKSTINKSAKSIPSRSSTYIGKGVSSKGSMSSKSKESKKYK